MPRHVLFVQGGGEGAHDEWDNTLVDRLGRELGKPMAGLGKRLPAQTPVFVYHGSEDATAPFEHVGLYARAIPQAVVRRLNGRDHQLNNDMSEVAADIRQLG